VKVFLAFWLPFFRLFLTHPHITPFGVFSRYILGMFFPERADPAFHLTISLIHRLPLGWCATALVERSSLQMHLIPLRTVEIRS